MTCESCGQKMDPFGDDGIDGTADAIIPADVSLAIGISVRARILHRHDDGYVIKVKAACSNCGHIQYGCRPKVKVNGYD